MEGHYHSGDRTGLLDEAKLDTSRATALAVSADSYLTHRLESLHAGKLPVATHEDSLNYSAVPHARASSRIRVSPQVQ